MKIEQGEKYLLAGSIAETGSIVEAVRPGQEGPAGVSTWWVKLWNGTVCEVQIEKLEPLF